MSRWIMPFWWACWIAWQTGTKSSSRWRGVRWLSSQYLVIGHAVNQFHDEVRQAGCSGPGIKDAGNIDVVHHRQGLPLGLEAGDDLPRIHPWLDDLQRHLPLDRLALLGHIHRAHASFADLLQ